MCVASFILALAGWLVVPFIGTFVGLVLGVIGVRQVKRSGEQGRGFGLAGIWLSIVQWLLLLLAILVMLVLFLLVWVPIWMSMPGYEMQTRTMEIDAPVRELQVSGSMTVRVVDDEQPVRISARSQVLEQVSIEQGEGVMKISLERGNNWFNNFNANNVTITLGSQALSKLHVRGSVDVVCDSMVAGKSGVTLINSAGSADVRIKRLETGNAKISLAGSTDVDIDGGQVESLEVSVTGSGDFNGKSLKAVRANATVAGSGSAKVFASDEFSGQVSGSGDIDVYGNPAVSNKVVRGSGSIDVK